MTRRSRPNRRKVESRLARLKPLKIGIGWRIKWRAVLLPPLVVGALLAAFDGARALLDQPVRRLVVQGTFQRVTPLQIEAAVEGDIDGGFLSLDLARLSERVERLDWVDRVKVGRAWPDTLIVDVTEHQAAARWGDTGLLNVRGELFTRQRSVPAAGAAELGRARGQRAGGRAALSRSARTVGRGGLEARGVDDG